MKTRLLLPVLGCAAGVLTALPFRGQTPPAPATPREGPSLLSIDRSAAALAEQSAALGAVAAYEALAAVPVAQLLSMLAPLQPGPAFQFRRDAAQQSALRDAIVQRLVERDPAALAAWLSGVPNGWMNWNWTGLTVRALLEAGTPAAKAALARLYKAHPHAAHAESEWLAVHQPAAALEKLLASRSAHMQPALAEWIAQDTARALRLANGHPAHAAALASAIGLQGRAALEAFLAGLTHPDSQQRTREAMLYLLAREGDAAAFAGLLRRTGDMNWRNEQALNSLARINPEAAADVVRKLADQPGLCGKMLASFAAQEPERAAALLTDPALATLPQRPLIQAMLHELTTTWLLSDPAAAKAWMTALPPENRALLFTRSQAWSRGLNSAEWMELSSALPVGGGEEHTIAGQAVEKLTDPALLAQWCASFSEEQSDRLRRAVCSSLAARDPAQATAFALRETTPEQARENLAAIAGRMTSKQSGEVLEWLDSLPPEHQFRSLEVMAPEMLTRAEAVPEMMAAVQERIAAEPPETLLKYGPLAGRAAEALMLSDRNACAGFLASLPEALRGPAIEQAHNHCYNTGFAPEHMAGTLEWVAKLPDAAVRRELAIRLCQTANDYPEQRPQIQAALERFTK